MEWTTIEVPPLQNRDDLDDSDRAVQYLLPCLRLIEKEVLTFLEQDGLDGPVQPALRLQLAAAMNEARFALARLLEGFKAGAEQGRLQAELLAQGGPRLIAPEDDLIIVGSDTRGPEWVAWAKTEDGTPVGHDLSIPHFTLFIGGLGTGKTHGLHLLEEVAVPTPGLSRADPDHHRLIRLSVNDREHINDQLLAGFRPNPYPASWERLQAQWGVSWTNRAFTEGWFFCLKDCLARYQKMYAEFVERGLVIAPLQVHYEEMDYPAYEAIILGSGVRSHRGQAAWCRLLKAILADQGPNARPRTIVQAMKKHKADRRAVGALEAYVPILDELCTDQVHLVDCLEKPWPLLLQMESDTWGLPMVLSAQVVVLGAVGKPLRSGKKVMRHVNMDELGLQLQEETALDQVFAKGTLLRHGWMSLSCAAQGARSIDPRLAPLVTVVVYMGTAAAADLGIASRLWSFYGGRFAERVQQLKKYQGLLGSPKSTHEIFTREAQVVQVRDSILWTAGETRRIG
jgi:hypothetical protein